MWAIPSKIKFRSLRWRIAALYSALLCGVIAIVAFVMMFELREILLGQARIQADRTGADISRVATASGALLPIGDFISPQQQLTQPGNLEHWASPTTYIEIDRSDGYPLAKSSNMGGATFATASEPRQKPVVYSSQQSQLGEVLVRDERLVLPDKSVLIVKVGEGLDLYYATLARFRTLLIVVVSAAATAVVVASAALSRGALQPINRLIEAMREISSEQLHKRLGWTNRSDEIGQLATTFDAMLDRLEDGFARERQFISDASHELKTPLTVINANAQMLERWADRDPEIRRESLHAITAESAGLARMVNGMLTLAKAESGDGIPRAPTHLEAVVRESVGAVKPRADDKGLALEFSAEGDPVVMGDQNLLRQLFTNLIDNAVKFTENGSVAVRVEGDAQTAVVSVADSGIGIDTEALERVFDRFYRTDVSRSRQVEGTGLGLAIARSIARVHDGSISAAANPGGGTIFRVTLPAFIPSS